MQHFLHISIIYGFVSMFFISKIIKPPMVFLVTSKKIVEAHGGNIRVDLVHAQVLETVIAEQFQTFGAITFIPVFLFRHQDPNGCPPVFRLQVKHVDEPHGSVSFGTDHQAQLFDVINIPMSIFNTGF